jgi:hypothetical protein
LAWKSPATPPRKAELYRRAAILFDAAAYFLQRPTSSRLIAGRRFIAEALRLRQQIEESASGFHGALERNPIK